MTDTLDGIYRKNPDTGYGVGGINGMHHKNAVGWDNTTVGMASSVFDNLLSQNGVRTNDPNYIGALEPIRAGKFIVKWLKVPTFFDAVAVKYLKFFLENAVKSVSGLSDNQINAAGSLTFGANGQEMDFPGQLKENNKNVQLTTITCTGDGLGKLMRYWQYGITDPITNVHHMYGKNLRFIRPNYSGTLMYIFMGPTCRPGDIEYSCIWHEVWPSSGDGKDKWNSQEIGSDQAVGEQTVELSGIFQDGPECNILAKYIVAGTGLAGQSYFDQMLPAYMYDKYIGNIKGQKDTNETIQGLSLAQEHKMSAANVGTTYTADVQNIRTEMLSKYGLDSEALPSKTSTAGFKNEIQEIDEFDTTKYTDPTDPSTMK
jgi:hypothetical protein